MHDTQAMTTPQQRITGRHLAHRSRGATTLHHYERISSRDLEWHRRDNGRDKRRGGTNCFFDKRVKLKNLEKVKPYREKNTTEINEVESTPVGKRKQGITNSDNTPRFKRDEKNLIKRQNLRSGHTLRLNG